LTTGAASFPGSFPKKDPGYEVATAVPPSELLFNRQVQGKLPILQKRNLVNRHNEAREKEGERQQCKNVTLMKRETFEKAQ
jgi:hypothetical protein